MTPDITVSIVSYNTRDLLRACLRSLLARQAEGEAALEIIVADNGSTDGTLEMARAEFPAVRLVETGGNIGYGRANNLALNEAQGRYVFVLNSDTEVETGALAAMRDFLDARSEVGAVGAQLILPDGSIQASCGRIPTLLGVFWEQTYLDKLFPQNRVTGRYAMTDWDYRTIRQVEQVCGACLFVRKSAFEQIGGFDPAYFMYFEDTDLCVRLGQAGWPIWFLAQARIQHHLGASSGGTWQTRARMIASYNQSRFYYFSRYAGPFRGKILKTWTLLGAALRLGIWTLLSLTRPQARDQVRLFREVFRQTWKMQV
ncbi:MAG: glycosyltransferase [Armatimonadota bacterium]|nr:glycosyltransferase [Armatimonadota bacterium]